jgi:hypothetical protein
MERAKWLLLMNVKCEPLAMVWGFITGISQALFPEVCSQTFALQQAPPRRGAFVIIASQFLSRIYSLTFF